MDFYNTNVMVGERVWITTQNYYLDWFDRSHPNVPINRDGKTFCLQWMDIIQGNKP